MSEKVLTDLCSIPTAPFAEQRVIAWVLAWAKKRRRIRVRRDRFGNMLLELPGKSAKARTVMVAHLDHPGFLVEEVFDDKHVRARFHGGVHPKFFVGSAARVFTADGEVRGKVMDLDADYATRNIYATLRVASPVQVGDFAMWDQGEPRITGNRFTGRVCDDLAGAASALAALDALHKTKTNATVAVLLTRAEEQGFIGAIAAAEDGKLLRKSDLIISIECSAQQPYAKQGNGVIVRTGDRTSIFNSAFTRFITLRAEALAKKDPKFLHQRALMPGGTCEATVFDAWNFTAAAVCVPLGNYHNMNHDTGKIGPEYVDLRDWRHMVTLLTDVARHAHTFTGEHTDLRQQLLDRLETFKPLLKPR